MNNSANRVALSNTVALTNRVALSNKCLWETSNINETHIKTLMTNGIIKVEHILVNVSSQDPQNKSLKKNYSKY